MNQQNLISGISKTDRSDKSLIQHPKPVINRFPFIQYIYLGDSLPPKNTALTSMRASLEHSIPAVGLNSAARKPEAGFAILLTQEVGEILKFL